MMLFRIVLLLSLPSYSLAASSFTYNNDVKCSYPFSDFSISALSCQSRTFVFLEGEGNDKDAQRDENGGDVCYFEDQADISGQVTIDEAVARYFDIYLTICFKGSYYTKSCKKYKTALDLYDYTNNGQQQQSNNYNNFNNGQDGYDARDANEVDFLAVGTHKWKSRVQIPKKSFTFKSGSVVTAAISFHPKKIYLGPQQYSYSYNGIPYHNSETNCYATFSAVAVDENSSEYSYSSSYRYSASAAALVVLGALGLVTRKRRQEAQKQQIALEGNGEASSAATEKTSSEHTFEMMSDDESPAVLC